MEYINLLFSIIFFCDNCLHKIFTLEIKFTKPYYQVSVYQDQGVRRYVTHSEFQMGVMKPPGNITVNFRIREKSEIINTFTSESFLLGDFYYLRIRTNSLATLNRERISSYNLSVVAVINEESKASSQVQVRVLDRNDNCPIFSKEIFDLIVNEDASIATAVGAVTATDADEGLNSEIFYYTHRFQDQNFPFSLDPFTGVIHPTERLHRFAAQKFSSQIAAVHRGDVGLINCDVISQALLVVSVLPNNRNSPKITVNTLPVHFDPHLDNYPYAEVIVTDDDDRDQNITRRRAYGLIIKNSSHSTIHFSLSSTAIINKHILKIRPLSPSVVPDSVTVVLEANDLSSSPRISSLSLTIDLNKFKDISFLTIPSLVSVNVPENTIINSTVLLLRPLLNTSIDNLQFRLISDSDGTLHGDISISSSGIVSVRRKLNAEDIYFRERKVTVGVSSPQWWTSTRSVSLRIVIDDINEYPPVISNNGSTIIVLEDVSVGSTLFQIDAYDPDISRTRLTYYLFDEESLPFTLADYARHKVLLRTSLDAETMPRVFHIRVLVSDNGSPLPRSVIAHYNIQIEDVNEYRPEFPHRHCNISISRHLPFDSRLGDFLAEDLDRDSLHNVKISLASTSLQEPCFSVNPQTGSLVLLCSLRNQIFIKVRNFVINLQANDGPIPSKKLALNVTVVDPNDPLLKGKAINQDCDDNDVYTKMNNNLKLLQKHYWKENTNKESMSKMSGVRDLPKFLTNIPSVIHVREEVALGHVVQNLEMKTNNDGRDPYESVFVFGVWSQIDDQVFLVNQTSLNSAQLIVSDRLDRERLNKYTLTLTACDNGQPQYCTTKIITVRVEDVNDQYPTFVDSFQAPIEILESYPVGKKILQVEATDADEYNTLQYKLVNFKDTFRLHKRTGWLKLRAALDREERGTYTLVITASDISSQRKSLTSTLLINIFVTDVNDNKPLFSRTSYSLAVPEDLPVGSFLVQLHATDLDDGVNGELRYALHGIQTDCFKCDEITGTVHLFCKLSSSNSYRLIAVVKDNGRPQSLSSQADFTVRPQRIQVNMYPPILERSLIHAYIKENSPPGTLVTTLKIEDALKSPGKYIFTISGQSSGISRFHINTNGEIRTTTIVDRERHMSFWLFIYVEDRNEAVVHRTLAEIYIEVLDENDNWPMPDRAFYKARVVENLQSSIEVLTIKATDDDAAFNATLKFKIISGDPMGHFSISQAGTIRTTERSIDRESFSGSKSSCLFSDSYDLKVSISDSGSPERITAVNVRVDIDDTNDNNPMFLNNNYFVFNHYILKETNQLHEQYNKKVYIGRVVAVDIDRDLNGTVRYSMTPGYLTNHSYNAGILQMFSVNVETGRLYMNLSNQLQNILKNDTRTDRSFEFKVWAFDLGVPTTWSVIPATVLVRLLLLNNDSTHTSSDGREGLHLAYQLPESLSLLYDECIGYELLPIPVVDILDPSGSSLQITLEDINNPFSIFWAKRGGTLRYQSEASLVISQSLIDSRESFVLRILIRNGQTVLRHNLTVNIKFYNKEPPIFVTDSQDLVILDINYSSAVSTVIFKAMAKSPLPDYLQTHTFASNLSRNIPPTTDIIIYSIVASNDPDTVQQLFYLHSNNGDLTIVAPLHAYRGRTFQLIIEARRKKSTYMKLHLHILESDNLPPQFLISLKMRTEYQNHLKSLILSPLGGLEEKDKSLIQKHIYKSLITWFGWVDPGSVLGTLVVTVPAFDPDYGNNGVLRYSIKNDSLSATFFAMNINNGDIRVARDLSLLLNRVILLNIVVQDMGSPSLYNHSIIAIHIRNAIPVGRLPQMDKTQLELSVYENVPINTVLHCLKLRLTVFTTIPIQYVLIKTTPENGDLFGVTRTTGCIITSSIIDRELIQGPINLEIQVQLYTGQISSYNSIVSVKIHIVDVNDNSPIFLSPLKIYGVISESANPGSVIFTKSGSGSEALMKALIINVEDPDEGENGMIDFSITSTAMAHFQIDSHTGVLSLAAPLDREIFGDFVTLTVQLTDRGRPPLMGHQILEIIVNILDENDCPPKFEKDFYIQNLLLPTYANAPLLQVRVTDPDVGNKIVFSIINGNEEGFFSLDKNSGWLTIRSDNVPKTSQLPRVLLMNIKASDGIHETRGNITIYRLDDTLRQPLPLEQNNIKWTIPENEINVPHLVLPRTTLSYFSKSQTPIKYVLLSLHPSVVLDESFGSLRLINSLDREKEPYFSLLVLARGWDSSHGYINITVIVTDVNDFKPIFLQDIYLFLVDTNSSGNVQSIKIKAIDLDAGSNGTLSYYIDFMRPYTDEMKFSINSTSGIITVTRIPVPTMVGKSFSLMVRVADGGRPRLSATSTVVIDIVSDKSPLFTSSNYSSSVWEDSPKNSIITTVHASSNTGHTILYTISKGNDDELFDLDFTTGVIRLVGSLDYEKQFQHFLVISATDPSSSLSHYTSVYITVMNRPDEQPLFSNSSYSVSISEKILPNIVIAKVSVEVNIQHPKIVLFSLEDIPSSSSCNSYNFNINKKTGELTIGKELDFEKCEIHLFWVLAIFEGGFSTPSKTLMKVVIIDENDNAPVFIKSNFTAVISAQSLPSSLVLITPATDIDTNTNLHYKIIDASQNIFKIDRYSGFIRYNPGPSNRAIITKSQIVTFKVLVHDTIHSTIANVTVKLVSTSINPPLFQRKTIQMVIPENTNLGMEVGRLTTTDSDPEKLESLQYRFIGGFEMQNFNLDRKSGRITVKQPLDREKRKSYELRVGVSDGGGRHDFADILIHVTDINDNGPTFDQSYYEVTVSKSQHSQAILQLQASDTDQNPLYRMDYRLVYPNYNLSLVNIDTITGQISLKPLWMIDNILNKTYSNSSKSNLHVQSLLVQVCEQPVVSYRFAGLPMSCGTKIPVTINLFSQPLAFTPVVTCSLKSVSENNAMQQLIAVCRVTPHIENKGKWSLISGEASIISENNFEIDSKMGYIRARKTMDYEQQPQYRLTVEYKDAESFMIATRSLIIDLIDQNDCSPIFDNSRYTISISEDILVGSRLIQCKAMDLDFEGKDKITYSIDQAKGPDQESMFRIDEFGWLYVISSLDYEKEKRLEITVFASDSGGHVTNVTVTISVLDVNDEPPFWTKTSLRDEIEIIEDCDTCEGTFPRVIYRLEARDNDTFFQKEPLRFLISNQNMSPYLSYFSVSDNGEIQLLQALDAEKITGSLELKILASDGLHWSLDEFSLVVKIQDVNDHSPICDQSQRLVLSEDTKPGTVITVIKAFDRDVSAKFSTLTYTLIECSDPYLLVVEPTTGSVIINAPLDREFKSQINFKVEVSDIGLKKCSLSATIIVTDVNDNSPLFLQSKIAPVPEDAPYGSVIGKIHAEDADAGLNRKIKYDIIDNLSSGFSIDRNTGIMRVASILDRETVPVHKLTVIAADYGRPVARTSSITVTIELLDVNDCPPVFINTPLQINISEDALVGSRLFIIKAVSEDLGQNAVISYRILMEQDQFKLNSSSGSLTLAQGLDYEQNKEFFLSVEAKDGGQPSLSTTAVISIHVQDVNDNLPVFPKLPYLLALMENMPIGKLVGKITALDSDSDKNGKIAYSLVEWAQDQHWNNKSNFNKLEHFFRLRRDSGEIFLQFVPDREVQSKYKFLISATDHGVPPLSSVTKVTLEIEDMNDNPPLFEKESYRFLIQVDRSGIIPRGELRLNGDMFEVGRMLVSDKDGPTNSRPFMCTLLNSESTTLFSVKMDDKNDHCVLLVSGILHLGSRNLIVQVNDNGLTTLYRRCRVVVDVIRLSNIPPEIEPLNVTHIYFHSFTSVKKEATVSRVLVKDRSHAYDKLKFELIVNGSSRPQDIYMKDLFRIDSLSGVITTTDQLDSGLYPLVVKVTNGSLAAHKVIFIKIIALTQEMVDSACVIQINNMKPDFFFTQRLDLKVIEFLKKAMASKLAYIISAKSSSRIFNHRKKRELAPDDIIDILVSVYDENENRFFKSGALVTRINNLIQDLSRKLEVSYARAFDSICNDKHVCVQGQCHTNIKVIPEEAVNRFQVHGVTFSSPDFVYSSVCKCDKYFGGDRCQIPLNKCAHKPCGHIRVCRIDQSKPSGFVCECPAFKKGENCDQVVEIENTSSCLDEQCVILRESEPIHFNGGGYLKWILGKLGKTHRIDFSFGFRLLQKPAPLVEIRWNSLRSLTIDVTERGSLIIQSGYKTIPEFDIFESHSLISDGRWHTLRVSIVGVENVLDWWLHIVLDGLQPRLHSLEAWVEGDTFNQTILLAARNMLLADNKWDLLSSSAAGCFKDILVNGIRIPYQQLPASGQHPLVKVVSKNLNFGCSERLLSGYCGIGVCKNAGICKQAEDSNVSYSCQCQGPFSGKDCAVFQEPCKFSPCLHSGKCSDLSDGYQCSCPEGLSGSQCQWGRACSSIMSPCPQFSSCIEHLISEQSSASVCRCPPSFQGYLCQTDVDECEIRPPICQPGKGTCHNLYGGYQCNCSLGYSGQHCETDSLINIHSDTSTLGLSQFHIYFIIGVLACLFVLALLTVVVLVLRLKPASNMHSRKKRDRTTVLSLDPLYQIKPYPGDQCSRYSPASSMMASSIHHPPGYVGGFMVEPPPGTPGGRSQMSYQLAQGAHYRRLSQDAIDRMSLCSSNYGGKENNTPVQIPAHYQKSGRATMFMKPGIDPRQGISPHSSTFSLVPCHVGPQQHLHLVPNRNSMLLCHGGGPQRMVYDPAMIGNSNLSLHSSRGLSGQWELNEEMIPGSVTDLTPEECSHINKNSNAAMRQISSDTQGPVMNGDIEHSMISWNGQYNDEPILNKEMISSQEMSFTETTDRSTALLLPKPKRGMMLHSSLLTVSSQSEAPVPPPTNQVNGNKNAPSTASPSSTSIPSGTNSSDTKGTAPVCEELVRQKKGNKASPDTNSAEGTECDTDDIEMDQQPLCPSTFPPNRHLQEEDVEDGLAAMPLLDTSV